MDARRFWSMLSDIISPRARGPCLMRQAYLFIYLSIMTVFFMSCLQCFDTVGWVSERAPGL